MISELLSEYAVTLVEPVTELEWSLRVSRVAPIAASHIRTGLSTELDASCLLPGDKAMALTPSLWPLSVDSSDLDPASYNLTVLSSDADASILPSGEKATALTKFSWPLSVDSSAPDLASHSLTVLSRDADASILPSGEKATAQTESSWPLSVDSSAPDLASHSLTVLSYEADASILPSGEKVTVLTLYPWPFSVDSSVTFSVTPFLTRNRVTGSFLAPNAMRNGLGFPDSSSFRGNTFNRSSATLASLNSATAWKGSKDCSPIEAYNGRLYIRILTCSCCLIVTSKSP
jgi:hypothetical protein